nr:MAG TPA: hypothetical protein [Bacteriophage sp.]
MWVVPFHKRSNDVRRGGLGKSPRFFIGEK